MASADYVTEELLSAGRSALVYRALRVRDRHRVVLKTLRPEIRGPEARERLRGEYERLRRLDDPRIARALAFETSGDAVVLVMEDVVGRSLADVLHERGPLDIGKTLHVACELARALEVVHRNGLIHRDVSPHNVVLGESGGTMVLVDFGLAVVLGDDEESIPPVDELVGTAAYVPPEQTGRVRQPTDPRADLYGLGATLYHALVGHPPFITDDLGELIHAHLAITPRPVGDAAPRVPRVLAGIIDRLLAKDPDARFQSAAGLRAAFEACQEGWLAGDLDARIIPVEGAREGVLPLRTPLVGRDQLVARVHAALRSTARGVNPVIALSGASGSGKSRIVEAVGEFLRREGAHVAVGKFDQHAEAIPYMGLTSALRAILPSLLAEWTPDKRAALSASIGSMAPLATAAFPELAELFRTTLRDRAVEFSEHAFQGLVRVLLEAIASPAHPLVVVLDDLHWSDPASLAFLEGLSDSPPEAAVAWLITYRADEVVAAHPLLPRLERLRASNPYFDEISISPLSRAETSALVAEMLAPVAGGIEDLAARIHLEAEGNPFFSGLILQSMVDRGELRFDRARGRWRWRERRADAPTSRALEVLVGERLQRLPELTRRALRVAAVIGSRSDARTVSGVLRLDPAAVIQILRPAMTAALIQGPDRHDDTRVGRGEPGDIAFIHDRLREAVLATVPAEQQAQLHLELARAVRSRTGTDAPDHYAIARHYEAAGDLLADPLERREAAKLSVIAASMARRTGAHEAALRFIAFALRLHEGASWSDEYDGLFSAQYEALECENAAGALAAAEERANWLMERARDALDQARVLVALVLVYTTQRRYEDAIAASNDGLLRLGAPIPTKTAPWKLARDALLVKVKTRHLYSVEDVLALPRLKDDRLYMALKLTAVSQAALVFTDPRLLLARAFRALLLTLRSGLSDLAAIFFAVFAPTWVHEFNDVERARFWMDAALALGAAEPNPLIEAMNAMNTEVFGKAWFEPVRDVRLRLEATYRRSLVLGDYAYALYSTQHTVFFGWFEGMEVPALAERISAARGIGRSELRGDFDLVFEIFAQVCASLGDPGRDDGLKPQVFRAELSLPGTSGHRDLIQYAWRMFRLVMATYRGDYDGLEPREEGLLHLGRSLAGAIPRIDYNFYRVLHLAAIHQRQPPRAQKESATTMERLLVGLRRWGLRCPENFEARALLAEAESLRALRPDATLAGRYLAAHDSARRHGARHLEALALELGGRHELSCSREGAGVMLLRGAVDAYRRWGALAVAARVEAELAALGVDSAAPALGQAGGGSSSSSLTNALRSVDLAAVLRVSQAVARELALDPLLRTLMQVLLESSGARRCALALVTNDKLRVEARATADPADIRVLESAPLAHAKDLPRALLRRVAATRETEILDDAAARASLPSDDHMGERCPLSMMCIPIEYQGDLVGVLYLENELVRGVFSPERALFLTQLTAQLTAVIVNARLTHAYRKFVPHEFIELLGKKRVTDVRLGDHAQRDMTVMFADIRGFSTRTEKMTPRESFIFVNVTLESTGPVVRKHGGFIDKYLGDAIMALFPRAADDAVKAAIEMLGNLHAYNETHRGDAGHEDVRVGVGINSGMLMLGTIGEHGRMDGTVISDAVNLASRVEGITKLHGSELLITEFTRERLADPAAFATREIDRVRVKGRRQPVTVYEVLDAEAPDQRERKERHRGRFEAALEHFRRGELVDAQVAFAEIAGHDPGDRSARVFLDRCKYLLARGLPADWDGVFQLDVK